MASATTRAQIAALASALRGKSDGALRGVLGVTTRERCDGSEDVAVGAARVPLRQCDSALEVREALQDAGDGPLVILTPLDDGDLEADVRARLHSRRLTTLRPWDAVAIELGARGLDPRLDDDAVAHAILRAPGLRTRAVPAGFLDLDTAWDLAAESVGWRSGRPDVLELLRCAHDGGAEAWRAAPEDLRRALRRRARESAGVAGELVLDALDEATGDVVALGLVCAVVFAPHAPAEARGALDRAAGRLERFCGHRALPAAAGLRWAQEARTWIADRRAERDQATLRATLQAADALLREIDAHAWAHLSDLSPLGFEQRLQKLAQALERALDAPESEPAARDVESAVDQVRTHALAREAESRVSHATFALRLTRALRVQTRIASAFGEALVSYASDGGFVDWARDELADGDPCDALSRAYARLRSEATSRREAQNEAFARALAGWLRSGGALPSAWPVEDLLDAVVAPLAAHAPLLLLVIDGLSVAVYRALVEDLVGDGWVESVPADGPAPRAAIAALPSVTEVSRASLLCGRLTVGQAADEKAGFATHPALVARCRRGAPPVLLHKADLIEEGEAGLASSARALLGDAERRIVGVVLNAVDDHLAKGDQLRPRWCLDAIRPLRGVLHAALAAGRTLVITSDHGHVVEAGSRAGVSAEALRWRNDDGAPAEGEIALAGERVLLPTAAHRLIAPWSERLRYGSRKNGYHGGASPQEVVIPLGVFRAASEGAEPRPLPGWVESPAYYPAWWRSEGALADPGAQPARAPRRRRQRDEAQAPLPFVGAPVSEPSPVAGERDWIAELVRSAAWKAQVQAAGRVAVDEARLRLALTAFGERGGTLTRAALAHKLGLPLLRVGGFVSGLRRMLNVDGYEVLACDDVADTLRLDRELLRRQFGLAGE